MIRYIKNNYLDRSKYDLCIRMDNLGLPYGYSWYLDEVCSQWDCLVLNDYDAVWPLPFRRKWGFKYFYRPFGIQQLGIFTKRTLSSEVLLEFLKKMQSNCNFAEIFSNEEQFYFPSLPEGLNNFDNTNLTLSLDRSFREIYHAYNKHTQRNIVKASKFNLQIFERDDPARIIELFREHRGSALKLSEEFYRNMSRVMYQSLHKGIGKVWTVYDERNSLCAGIFVLESERRHTMLFSASSEEGKEMRAMFHLINEYLIYSSNQNKIFDFEGSNSQGLQRFYSGFGADSVSYKGLKYNGLPIPIRWLKK